MQVYWSTSEAGQPDGRSFPFWSGNPDSKTLDNTTSKLSQWYRAIFAEAGSDDLHFHDTRHEAVCRRFMVSAITSGQLARAAGMSDARTRPRYLSLRGSELAARRSIKSPAPCKSGAGSCTLTGTPMIVRDTEGIPCVPE